MTSRTILFLIGLVAFGQAAHATIVYDNLGPNNTYSGSGVWFGHHPTFNKPYSWHVEATSFAPRQSGRLDRLTLAVYNMYGDADVSLWLRADDSGRPGQDLWHNEFRGVAGAPLSVLVLDDLNGPWLESGQRYWLVADTLEEGSAQAWLRGLTGIDLAAGQYPDLSNNWDRYWSVPGHGLRVEVIVPEPSCLTIVGLASVALLRRRGLR